MGAVIKLELPQVPEVKRLCCDCANAALSRWGVYCMVYQELIYDELGAASDCEQWEE